MWRHAWLHAAAAAALLGCAAVLSHPQRIQKRTTTAPFIADALGNSLPPPAELPATVGSPSNLLTPDRYEFYTFDETGELVKRLMTLDEIQAIVAAGDGNDGHMVTFAQDDKPTIAFNFSQPPFTKVHSVVANVQNVLKSQMEAQKKNPPVPTSFDTPDVSNSWSMILPSIFGNTGVDIVPDKIPTSFGTPETDTIDDGPVYSDNRVSSKEDPDEDVIANAKNDQLLNNVKINIEEHHSAKIATTTKPSPSSTYASITKPIIFTTRPSLPVSFTKSTRPSITTLTSSTAKPSTTEAKPSPFASFLSTITTNPPVITTLTATITRTSTTVRSTNKQNVSTTTPSPYTTSPYKISTKLTTITQNPSPTAIKTSTTSTQTNSITSRPTTSTTFETKQIIGKVTPTYPTSSAPKSKPTTSRPLPTISQSKTNTEIQTKALPKSTVTVSTIKTTTPSTTVSHFTTASNIHEVKTTVSKIKPTNPTISTLSKRPAENQEKRIPEKITSTSTIFSKNSHASPSTTTEINYVEITKPKLTIIPFTTTKNSPKVTTPKIEINPESDIYYVPLITTNKASNAVLSTEHFEKIEQSTHSIKNINDYSTATTQSSPPTITNTNITLQLNEVTSAKPNIVDKPFVQNHTQEELNPIFDVAQSISQIASDLGNSFVDKNDNLEAEIKENTGFDLPDVTSTETIILSNSGSDFIKIPTSDPENVKPTTTTQLINFTKNQNKILESTQSFPQDHILSESMSTVLSQVADDEPNKILKSNYSSSSTEFPLSLNPEVVKLTTPIALDHHSSANFEKDLPSNDTNFNSLNDSVNATSIIPIISHTSSVTTPRIIQKYSTTEKNIPEEKITDLKTTKPNVSNGNSNPITTSSKVGSQNVDFSETKVESIDKYKLTIKPNTEKESTKIMHNLDQTEISHEKTDGESSTSKPILSNFTENPKKHDSFEIKNKETSIISTNESFQQQKLNDTKKKIQKVNIDEKEYTDVKNDSWKLVSTVSPPKSNEPTYLADEPLKPSSQTSINFDNNKESFGLEVTTKNLSEDVFQFIELCNELAFRYWSTMVEKIDNKRSFVLSPYSITSMLAMMFMGARGATSGEMNDILKLDDMVTFNPHFVLKNISDSIDNAHDSGVGVSAFVKELYSDRNSGKLLTFYKERAQHFYSGHVEEINFKTINDIIRRRTNLLIKRYTWGKINEFMKTDDITMRPPLAAFSANIFETDCSRGGSIEGRDGEMYFAVSPSVRQRRLIPVPAVTFRRGFLAGYEPALDATAAALGSTSIVSTVFLMPGQQGNAVRSDDLERLESRLLEATSSGAAWSRLLRTLHPRSGLELQLPRFAHRSLFNVSSALRSMGLRDIFQPDLADLAGLSGPSHSLHLSDMMETSAFANCGDPERHSEVYPEPGAASASRRRRWDEPRDYQRAFHDPHDLGPSALLPLHLRPRQARLPTSSQPLALRFDRPFLYLVRHNPTGMIIYVGRYNPRLLP